MPGHDAADVVEAGATAAEIEALLAGAAPFRTAVESAPAFRLLRDLRHDASLLDLPAVIVPHLAWAGRLTLLYAREKVGKSTLARQAVAACELGASFLGAPTPPGRVLWLGLDEPLGDIVRSLDAHDAGATDAIAIRDTPYESADAWIAALQAHGATLCVVDALADLAAGTIRDAGQSAQWAALFTDLKRVCRESGCALLLIHHEAKGGGYRDSTVIGASVDHLAQLEEVSGDATRRTLKGKGRVQRSELRIEFVEGSYHLATGTATPSGPTSQHEQTCLRLLVEAEPHGYTFNEWRIESGLSKSTFNRVRKALVIAGHALEPQAGGRGRYRALDAGVQRLAAADP